MLQDAKKALSRRVTTDADVVNIYFQIDNIHTERPWSKEVQPIMKRIKLVRICLLNFSKITYLFLRNKIHILPRLLRKFKSCLTAFIDLSKRG